MKIMGEEIPRGSVRKADVCIIGSGAAGITLARELIRSRLKVVLLEGGSMEWTEGSQNIYKAASVSTSPVGVLDKDFPSWSRLRQFGGSTNHWGGWSRPFEEHDFAKRSWLPLSGWPITLKDLGSYYARAATYIEMENFDQAEEKNRPALAGVTTREFHYSPPTRFGEKYGSELFAAPNVDVILQASAVRFDTQNDQVRKVWVKSPGTEFTVEAQVFILACGGMENPRLMLNSDHQRTNGLGNSSDMVGRGFMEHPHATIGMFVNTGEEDWLKPFRFSGQGEPMRIFTTTAEFQEKHQVLNYSCQVDPRSKPDADPSEGLNLTRFSYGKGEATNYLRLYTRSEMMPDPNNRISLANERDELGLRRLQMHLNFSRTDLRTVVKSTEAVIERLSAEAYGRGKIVLERDDLWSTDLGPGCHHMGTTRMSENPREGVVDQNCKVHDLANLYVAGSSVFPTGGFANPTFTIVALALRLSDHLQTLVRGAV